MPGEEERKAGRIYLSGYGSSTEINDVMGIISCSAKPKSARRQTDTGTERRQGLPWQRGRPSYEYAGSDVKDWVMRLIVDVRQRVGRTSRCEMFYFQSPVPKGVEGVYIYSRGEAGKRLRKGTAKKTRVVWSGSRMAGY